MAGLKTIDFVVEGIDRSKEIMIITDKIAKMRNIIHSIDKKAFVTISEVADMFKGNDYYERKN